ncbi:thioredoxin-like protein [Hyaloraphidium curvatum]|nr:thioredoxin-like protein [Hyaloraphidium curvatum]
MALRRVLAALTVVLLAVSASATVVDLDDSNFNSLVRSDGPPWIIKFYAKWCGACQSMAVEYEEFGKDVDEADMDLRIGRVDIDENPILVNRWTIMRLPTLMHVLPNREVREVELEARTAEGLMKYIKEEQWKNTTPRWSITGPYSLFGYFMGYMGWFVKQFGKIALWFEARPGYETALIVSISMICPIIVSYSFHRSREREKAAKEAAKEAARANGASGSGAAGTPKKAKAKKTS